MSGVTPPLLYAFTTCTGALLPDIKSCNAGTCKSNDNRNWVVPNDKFASVRSLLCGRTVNPKAKMTSSRPKFKKVPREYRAC